MKKYLYPVFGIILLLFGLVRPVFAHEDPVVNVAIFKGIPWSELSKNSPGMGIVPAFWKELEKRSNVRLNLRIQPYKRMIHSLATGHDDMAIFFRSQKSEAVADPVEKVISLPTVVITKEAGKTHRYPDLKNHIIAGKLGVFYDPVFDIDTSIRKIQVKDYSTVVDLLLYGRATAVVGSKVSLAFHLARKKQRIEQFSKPFVLKNNDVYLHISKKSKISQVVRERIIHALQSMKKDGIYQELIKNAVMFAHTEN